MQDLLGAGETSKKQSAAEKRAIEQYRMLHAAAGDLLRAIRTESVIQEDGSIIPGKCMICGAPSGIKHEPSCAAWPFIEGRLEAGAL